VFYCVIWLITTIFSILMVIHITHQPLFRILLTRHIITLTNIVCQIGLIRINNPCPQSYDHNFQNNFNSSQSQWGFTSPESNFQPTCPPYLPCPQYFQDSYSVPPVQNNKPSILEMSMRESKQQSQNLMD